MCIWKVSPEDRRCEFCTYRGGCEKFPVKPILQEVFERYVGIMSEVVGGDILRKDRHAKLVWARYLVQYQLNSEGYSMNGMSKLFKQNHSTIMYGLGCVKWALGNLSCYPEVDEIWSKFQEKLSQQKQ